MFKRATKYSAANLLERLADEGFIADQDQDLSDFIIDRHREKELPLYLRALVGVGAFIASFHFIGFLSVLAIISRSATGFIVWGLLFVAGAIGLQRIAGPGNEIKHSFYVQSSFVLMAVGKFYFTYGVYQALDSGWGVTLALLIITVLTYHVYRTSIDRFLSSFVLLFSISANVLWEQDVAGSRELLLNVFFLIQFAAAAILLTHGKIKRDYVPLSYAFAFSLCACVLFLASYSEFGYWEYKELIDSSFVNLILTAGLIALFGWAAGNVKKLKSKPLVLASAGAMLLGFISTPGILLAIGSMILGYAKHEKLLIIAGVLLMPVFLFLYYHNLDVSLLQKSGILMGSGAVLLAGRFYLKRKGWDKGGASCA